MVSGKLCQLHLLELFSIVTTPHHVSKSVSLPRWSNTNCKTN